MERKHLETLATDETVTLDCVVKNDNAKLRAGVNLTEDRLTLSTLN